MIKARGTTAVGLIASLALGLLLAMNASALAQGDQGFESQPSTALVQEGTETRLFPPIQPPSPFSSTQTFSARSFVENVRVYSITILEDRQISVGLRFKGDGGTPGVTVIVFTGVLTMPPRRVMPLPSTDLPRRITDTGEWSQEEPEIYPICGFSLIGSNLVSPGWQTPASVTVSLVGQGSLLEANHVEVVVVPYIPS